MKKMTGILLAGGMSFRYGSPKAFARWRDYYFYEHVFHQLQKQCDNIIIVTTKELLDLFPSDLNVITDMEPYVGCGPLAGTYSGMLTSDATDYIVLPCDMPLIQEKVLTGLLERHEGGITAVELNGQLQPLVSVWNHEVIEDIGHALDRKQYALQSFLRKQELTTVNASVLSNDPMTFLNINTSEEEKEMRKWIK